MSDESSQTSCRLYNYAQSFSLPFSAMPQNLHRMSIIYIASVGTLADYGRQHTISPCQLRVKIRIVFILEGWSLAISGCCFTHFELPNHNLYLNVFNVSIEPSEPSYLKMNFFPCCVCTLLQYNSTCLFAISKYILLRHQLIEDDTNWPFSFLATVIGCLTSEKSKLYRFLSSISAIKCFIKYGSITV